MGLVNERHSTLLLAKVTRYVNIFAKRQGLCYNVESKGKKAEYCSNSHASHISHVNQHLRGLTTSNTNSRVSRVQSDVGLSRRKWETGSSAVPATRQSVKRVPEFVGLRSARGICKPSKMPSPTDIHWTPSNTLLHWRLMAISRMMPVKLLRRYLW